LKKLHRYLLVGATTAVLAGTTTFAFAEGGPSIEQLQKDCGTVAKDCQLLDVRDHKEFLAEKKQVGQVAWGCSSGGGTQAISWSETVGTTTNVGGTATVSGGIIGVVNAGFSATFGKSWTESKTVGETTTVTVKPGRVAWIVRAAAMRSVVGDLSMWYPKKVDGHYNWIIQNLTVTGPSESPGNIIILDRAMTAAEKTAQCTTSPGPGVANLVADSGVVLSGDQMDNASAETSTPVGQQVTLPGAGSLTTPRVASGE
jgi:hypothetical protein